MFNIMDKDLGKEHEEVIIFVLSDAHIGEEFVNRGALNKFVDEVKNTPNGYVIVNGDMVNNALKDSVSDVYNDMWTPQQQVDIVVELLEPIKDKILVITEGNHERRTGKKAGFNLMYQVAKDLFGKDKAKDYYSEIAYLLYISFGKNNGRDYRQTVYSIYGRHGAGGGGKTGSKASKVESMLDVVNADIFIHSHTHQPIGFRLAKFYTDYRNRKVHLKDHLFVNTNAWLDYGGYGMEYGFRPASIEYPKIYLSGKTRKAKVLI